MINILINFNTRFRENITTQTKKFADRNQCTQLQARDGLRIIIFIGLQNVALEQNKWAIFNGSGQNREHCLLN